MTEPVCASAGASSEASPDAAALAWGRPLLSPTPCFRSAISSSVRSPEGWPPSVGIFRFGFFLSDSSKRRFCLAFKRQILRWSGLGGYSSHGLRFARPRCALLGGRLAVALLERGDDHGGNELLFPV